MGDHDGNVSETIKLIAEDKRSTWIREIDMISGSSCLTCDFNCFTLGCCQDVSIILRNYHSCSSVVRGDEAIKTLAETEEIWAKIRICRVAKTSEIRKQSFPGSPCCCCRPGLLKLPINKVARRIKTPRGVGGDTPLYLLYRDVPLDRVWFLGIPVLNRVYNSCVCVLNRVFIPWTSSRVLLSRVARARARQNIKHVSEHGMMFKALFLYFRSSLEQGPKSKQIVLNRASYFPDYYRVRFQQCQRHTPTQ